VIAAREDDTGMSVDKQHEEVGKGSGLWDDVNGRFTKVSGERREGSFSMTWLVKDSQLEGTEREGETFALKFLQHQGRLLTIKSTKELRLKQKLMERYNECAMQKHLVEQGERVSHKGAQRFISCHETNIPSRYDAKWSSGPEEDALWVLMEHGGEYTLLELIHSRYWTAELAKQLFKQLIEGLSFF